MSEQICPQWPYPGSRWWAVDIHTHTPASADTYWAKHKIDLAPQDWLSRYMTAGIDCVVVTDHNSGAWIDKLKVTYASMQAQAVAGSAPDGFRKLTLFPGVEISVQGGFHLLAVFDPVASTRTVTDLLAKVGSQATDGACDGVTKAGAAEVVQAVLEAGGIPIPAHADQDNGLLRVRQGTRECMLDANTVRHVMDIKGLLAVEWLDTSLPPPACVANQAGRLARIVGSDCHSFQGPAVPGSRYTWVKMARPTLEGLRLALLDGNGVSIRRSDEGPFEPFRTPAHFITGIEVERARFMGNGNPERLELTPYYNALIGGRGAGKSTVIHALRMAFRRGGELDRLSDDAEPTRHFKRFCKVVKGRSGDGALRDDTEVRVRLMLEGQSYRLRWRVDGKDPVVEEPGPDGSWQASASQAVNPERFPIRLFSQGQIAAMAGDGRQALLDVIDEAAGIGGRPSEFEDARNAYLSLRAKIRELDGRLAARPETERKLADQARKLDALASADHAAVLKAHQQATRQGREVDTTLEQLRAFPDRVEALERDLLLDDWPEGVFDATRDGDAIAWRAEAERSLAIARTELTRVVDVFRSRVQALAEDDRLGAWYHRAGAARAAHAALQAALAEQGVSDPQAFGRLVQERQQSEIELKRLDKLCEDRERLVAEITAQWQRVVDARRSITRARAAFLAGALQSNDFVRMEVVAFGFDARSFERSLRSVLGAPDRFETDILHPAMGDPEGGLAHELAQAADREAVLQSIKSRLIEGDNAFGGHFRNHLQRQRAKPEFIDHVQCWFPEDDLRIEYSRGGDGRDWSAITQGSQGQRSAALLAFLLAFGDEPMVLDQPEDDLDNHLIYELIVRQIRENKLRRQLIIVTHNPNVVVNGDAEMLHAFAFTGGQCRVTVRGALQQLAVRKEVCDVMEGGQVAFARRWARLGREI